MVTLNAKLTGIDDEKLIGRVVEIWGFFWDQVLPYVEGVRTPFTIIPGQNELIFDSRFYYLYIHIHFYLRYIETPKHTEHPLLPDKQHPRPPISTP